MRPAVVIQNAVESVGAGVDIEGLGRLRRAAPPSAVPATHKLSPRRG